MFIEILFALITATVLSAILVPWQRRVYHEHARHESVIGTSLLLFAVLFLATWSGGLWITPFGPLTWGVYWMPYATVGLLTALLIAAMVAPPRPAVKDPTAPPADAAAIAGTTFSVFAWLLIAAFAVAIVSAYI